MGASGEGELRKSRPRGIGFHWRPEIRDIYAAKSWGAREEFAGIKG